MNTKQLLLAIATIGVILTSCVDNSPTKTTTNDGTTNGTNGGTTAPTTYLNPNITYGSVTDIDGNKYATVIIGTQTWMAENLRVTHYTNGDAIPNITNNTNWSYITTGAQCTYYNTTSTDTITKYGRLYNFFAVTDSRNIAPVGWHIPTDAEWTKLTSYVDSHFGNSLNTAKALASTKGWYSSSRTGDIGNNPVLNNSTGFSAIPTGCRDDYDGHFNTSVSTSDWWTSSPGNFQTANFCFLSTNLNTVSYIGRTDNPRFNGLSVRCVKN
jgi:uncharacterized protein (TIGR02145 family)